MTGNPLTLYYLATPLFAVLDLALDSPVRVAALGPPELRYGYYIIGFLLGILCHHRPRVAPLVGITESSVNLLLLFRGASGRSNSLAAPNVQRARAVATHSGCNEDNEA